MSIELLKCPYCDSIDFTDEKGKAIGWWTGRDELICDKCGRLFIEEKKEEG